MTATDVAVVGAGLTGTLLAARCHAGAREW